MTYSPPRPIELTDELRRKLGAVSTATITSQLQSRKMPNAFLSGLKSLHPGQRIIGYAHTLRYVPARPDISATMGFNAQRVAVDSVVPDEVLIIEARNQPDAGTIGDIFAMRAQHLGAVAIITDGALRDTPAIRDLNVPVYHQASHASTLGRLHVPLDHQVPIACAGVTVMPGDIIVGDDEGAVVIPPSLVEEVADAAWKMELREEFAIEKVQSGLSFEGYFPLAKENRAEFDAWLEAKGVEY